jgi:CO/xanthine dehydrogenase Mo-binding subunit
VKRREFLIGAGAFGLFVTFPPFFKALESPLNADRPSGYPTDFNAYIKIGPDGRVGCFVGKVEMGQGIMTSLAMMVADELDVHPDRVEMVMGDTDLCPWDIGTWGSLTTWQLGPSLRAAAAEARAVLLQMAAERLGVPADKLRVQDGVVFVEGNSSRKVSYGGLVDGRRIERHLKDVKVKSLSEFTVMGKSAPRKDARAKVAGVAKFAADIALPGTLHACLVRPPFVGARCVSVDTSEAEKIPGVKVIRLGDMLAATHPNPDADHPGISPDEQGRGIVAVLHARPDIARAAVGKVKAQWAPSPWAVDDQTIFDHLVKTAPAAKQVTAKGSIPAGEAETALPLETTYLNSYVSHAPIEPHSAIAQWENGKVTVWASVQAPFIVKGQVVQALGLTPKNVRIITPYVGGAFGGKSGGPQAVEAARLAQVAGCPVSVTWNRAEEFLLDTYRPAAVVKVRSGIDKKGRITFWDFHVYCAGDREVETFYDIPHQRIRASGGWTAFPAGLHPFGIGPWRGPSAFTNVFARESHIDTLATMAGEDPLEFRLKHITEARPAAVLNAVAKQFGWKPKPAPSGRGVGIACFNMRNSIVAAMAEVAVDKKTGQVKVKRVAMALDVGPIVNPKGVREQMEGAITMGLGSALTEEIHFQAGTIKDWNFDTYLLPRYSWLPEIETVLVPSPNIPSQGVGEPPVSVMGAVIANAIHDAVGIRLLQLPMTPDRIKKALAAVNS